MQGFVEHRIGALVGERHRPWGGLACEGECVRLAVQSVKKKVFMMFLTCFKNLAMCSCVYVCLRFIRALCARHNGWLPWCLVVLRTRFLLESSLSDSMMVSRVLLGVDHGVDFAHFQR